MVWNTKLSCSLPHFLNFLSPIAGDALHTPWITHRPGRSDGKRRPQEFCSNQFGLQNCPAKELFHLKGGEHDRGQLLQVVRGDMDSNPLTASSNGVDYYKLYAGLQLPPRFTWNSQSKQQSRWRGLNPHPPTFHPFCGRQPHPPPAPAPTSQHSLGIFLLEKRFFIRVTLHPDWFFAFVSHKH